MSYNASAVTEKIVISYKSTAEIVVQVNGNPVIATGKIEGKGSKYGAIYIKPGDVVSYTAKGSGIFHITGSSNITVKVLAGGKELVNETGTLGGSVEKFRDT